MPPAVPDSRAPRPAVFMPKEVKDKFYSVRAPAARRLPGRA